jgi:hypothetical protein
MFSEMSYGSVWGIFGRRRVIKDGDFSPRRTDNSDEIIDEESQASDKFHCTGATTDTKKFRLYNESYLSVGFKWTYVSSCPIPFYLICGKRLRMAPAKLKRHLITYHSHMTSKIADYLKWLFGISELTESGFW